MRHQPIKIKALIASRAQVVSDLYRVEAIDKWQKIHF